MNTNISHILVKLHWETRLAKILQQNFFQNVRIPTYCASTLWLRFVSVRGVRFYKANHSTHVVCIFLPQIMYKTWKWDFSKLAIYKTGVLSDPLGQIHGPASSDHYILTWKLFCFARLWKVFTDGLKIVITTGRYCGSASWININYLNTIIK